MESERTFCARDGRGKRHWTGVGIGVAAAGYSVALAGRRLAELEKTAAMAGDGGGQMLPVATDVSKPDSVNALFAKVKEEFGRLDVLFNNAGLNAPGIPIEDLPLREVDGDRRRQSDRRVPVRASGVPHDEGSGSARRPHHQ